MFATSFMKIFELDVLIENIFLLTIQKVNQFALSGSVVALISFLSKTMLSGLSLGRKTELAKAAAIMQVRTKKGMGAL